MAKQFKYSCFKSTFKSIPEVLDHMQELNHELRRTDLTNLQFFNITYIIITKNIYAKIGTGYFSDDVLERNLTINFSGYYFDALRKYADNLQTTPAWKTAFDFYKQNKSMPLIYLTLGVNAHINNDLGFSLYDVFDKTGFKKEFDKINSVLVNSIDEIIKDTQISALYKPFIPLVIRHWRNNAWQNFIGLKEQITTKDAIESNADTIARSLTKINSVKDFYHLYNII